MLNDAQLERALLRAGLNRQVVAALLARGGGGALKYGRFAGQILGDPNNAPSGFALADATTTNLEVDLASDESAVGLTEPGIYSAVVTAVFNQIPTQPFTVNLGHSAQAPNIQTPAPGNPQNGQISASGEIMFSAASVAVPANIYPNVGVSEVLAGFTAVDLDVVIVRLGDVPAGIE